MGYLVVNYAIHQYVYKTVKLKQNKFVIYIYNELFSLRVSFYLFIIL